MLKRAPFAVVDDFLPPVLADAMRQDIEAHFNKPSAHRAATHQVWNYWFVPKLYAYLRTTPEKVIAQQSMESFFEALKKWSIGYCGMGAVTWPYLSLYVSGCKQGLHNDSANGRFGFVYSLTRNDRLTSGGETIIYRQGDYFREKLLKPDAGTGFYDLIEPRFNRLIIFDDRLPHAVERLEGTMDPLDGRFILHGHLSEAGTIISGALTAEMVEQTLAAPLREMIAKAEGILAARQGPLVLRLPVNQFGEVEACEVLTDRVIHPDPRDMAWQPWLETLIRFTGTLRFPAAAGATEIIHPIIFGRHFNDILRPATT